VPGHIHAPTSATVIGAGILAIVRIEPDRKATTMNAAEFFKTVVIPNYEQFVRNPTDLRSLWNAVVSMNTVAEFVALDRLEYAKISRSDLYDAAEQIRQSQPPLPDLKYCAETFKHVRKIPGWKEVPVSITASSTGLSSNPDTWQIDHHDPVTVLRNSFAVLKDLPELK
jgi:hypothetical protein